VDKTFTSPAAAVADIPDGASIAVGGFGTAGVPWALVRALRQQGARRLTIVTNNWASTARDSRCCCGSGVSTA